MLHAIVAVNIDGKVTATVFLHLQRKTDSHVKSLLAGRVFVSCFSDRVLCSAARRVLGEDEGG